MSRVDSPDSIAGVINIHRQGQYAGIRESITVDAVRPSNPPESAVTLWRLGDPCLLQFLIPNP
jgi:hypothetical protein